MYVHGRLTFAVLAETGSHAGGADEHYGRNNSVRSNIFALPTGGLGAVWQHADGFCECDIPAQCGDQVVYAQRWHFSPAAFQAFSEDCS